MSESRIYTAVVDARYHLWHLGIYGRIAVVAGLATAAWAATGWIIVEAVRLIL